MAFQVGIALAICQPDGYVDCHHSCRGGPVKELSKRREVLSRVEPAQLQGHRNPPGTCPIDAYGKSHLVRLFP